MPSDEQVKNNLFKNGEQDTQVTGPMCFSKFEVKGIGNKSFMSGFAWKTERAVTSFSPLSFTYLSTFFFTSRIDLGGKFARISTASCFHLTDVSY